MREEYGRFTVPLHLSKSLTLVRPGQFAVGHLECNDETITLLHPFKKVFIYRNLRDVVVSFMRFHEIPGRGGGADPSWKELPEGPAKLLRHLDVLAESLLNQCHTGWIDRPDVFNICFETLYGPEVTLLHPFKKVFIYRNLRDVVVSFMRFHEIPGRGGGADPSWKELPEGPAKLLRHLDVLAESLLASA